MRQRRISFSIRSVLITTLVVSVGLAWLRYETRGCLALEGVIVSSGQSPMVEISVDADRTELESSIRAALKRHACKHGFAPPAVSFTVVESENRRFLIYDFERWVRHRLDIRRCEYVLDYNDPIVRTRNEALAETIETAASIFDNSFHR